MFRCCSRLAASAPCDRRSVKSVVILVLLARVAAAHQSSTKYVDIRIHGERADVTLRCIPGDVTEPMRLAPDAKPTPAAAAAAANVPAYVASWLALRVSTDNGPVTCVARAPAAHAEDDGFIAVTWSVMCVQPIETLILDFSAFFALDKRMEALVRIDDDAAGNGWDIGSHGTSGGVDLLTTLMHEIGHALGLNHANDPSSVMYRESATSTISASDRATLRLIYLVPAGSLK